MNMMRHLRMLITRGRVLKAALAPARVLLQVSGLAGEIRNNIELLLPYGMSAFPAGGNVVLLQVGGSRQHLVALCADDSGLRITDLQQGEFGWRDANAQQIVFRSDRLEITTTKKVVGTASEWDLTGDLKVTGNITASGNVSDAVRSMAGDRTIYDEHTHGNVQTGGSNTGTPSPAM